MRITSVLPAIIAIAGFFSCQGPQQPEVLEATIVAGDVTVAEGKTVPINAATNSTAPITYSSDNTSVATVSSSGLVTGVKAGTANITLKVDAVEGQFSAAEKTIVATVTGSPEPQDNNPKPGTYTFTASPLKGQWKAGDQIYLQCGYGPASQVITLSASQLSADGKTASVDLDGDMFKYPTTPDPFYAVWPAEAVQKEEGLTSQIITYSVYDILLTQAYLSGTDFTFIDVSAFISFTVSGGYDRFMITGAQRPGLRISSYKNEYSSANSTPSKPRDDGYPFREGEMPAGETTIWFPGGITFNGGFTLFFAKGDNWTASYTYTEDIKLKAGKSLELGDITSKLTAYEGPKPAMPEIVSNTKFALKFNELSGICVDSSGDFVWAVGDGSEIAKISLSGELLGSAGLRTTSGSTLDSEGLSINYDTGDLLISGEANHVYRIPAGEIGNIFASSSFKGVEHLFDIADAKSFGNAGAEGCTYYKDGLVYIGTQTGSSLYCCNLETGEVLWRKGLREMYPAITEVAGLCYDPLTDWLWVVDSESHKFFALSGDAGQLLGAYLLKTKSNEESICVDHKNSCVWIGDDYGSTSYVYKYEMSGLDDFIIAQ